MTGFKVGASKEEKSDQKSVSEIFDMLKIYIIRETTKPIRGVFRWLGFGAVAAISLSIGVVLGTLGVLRLIQSLIFIDSSTWSWVNYIFALVVCCLIFVFTVSRIRKGSLEK